MMMMLMMLMMLMMMRPHAPYWHICIIRRRHTGSGDGGHLLPHLLSKTLLLSLIGQLPRMKLLRGRH